MDTVVVHRVVFFYTYMVEKLDYVLVNFGRQDVRHPLYMYKRSRCTGMTSFSFEVSLPDAVPPQAMPAFYCLRLNIQTSPTLSQP
jgi:hypothetical protein